MSDRPKFPRPLALNVARELCAALKPVTERLVVAGSLRRGKSQVGDVEILFVPKLGTRPLDFFSDEKYDRAAETINAMIAGGVIAMRPNVNGSNTWGDRNKLAVHVASGIPVDFFSTTEKNWWVSLVVRTGSKEMNLQLTTGARRLGRSLNAYGCGVTESDGHVIPATSEQHVFELCGVSYKEPKDR